MKYISEESWTYILEAQINIFERSHGYTYSRGVIYIQEVSYINRFQRNLGFRGIMDVHIQEGAYGVAMISRLLKMIGLFCKRAP